MRRLLEGALARPQNSLIFPAPAVLTRRFFLAGAAAGLSGIATGANAGVSALMCPPQIGSFGGGSGNGDVFGDETATDPDGDGLTDKYDGIIPDDGPGTRRLKVHYTRNNETFDMDYVVGGEYSKEALQHWKKVMRDDRNGEMIDFDPKLLDVLWKVRKLIGGDQHWVCTSAYRSPSTNAALRRRGLKAAKNSLHQYGKAMDLSIPGVSHKNVYAAGMKIAGGGVGGYDSFTHLDSGPHRTWRG